MCSRCPEHGELLIHVRDHLPKKRCSLWGIAWFVSKESIFLGRSSLRECEGKRYVWWIFSEIEEEYLEEDYNYIDGYDDEYYADGEEYFDEYSGGPNRGDQSLVSPESKTHASASFFLSSVLCVV